MKISKGFLYIQKIEIEIDNSHDSNSNINSPKIKELMRLRTININYVGYYIINMKVKCYVYLRHMIIVIANNMIVSLI